MPASTSAGSLREAWSYSQTASWNSDGSLRPSWRVAPAMAYRSRAPSVSRVYADGGRSAVRRVVTKSLLLMVLATGTLAAAVALAGAQLVELLYGTEFAGHQWTIAVFAVAMVADGIVIAVCNGLWAIGKPNVTFISGAVALVTTLLVMLVGVPLLGVLGAAIGVLMGKAVATSLQCISFYRSTRPAFEGEAA